MLKNNKKLLPIILIAVAALLTIGVTIAFVISSDSITNKFNIGEVEAEVTEKFDKQTKEDVAVKNTGDTDEYVRVAVVANWVNKDGEYSAVKPVEGTDYKVTYTTNTDWVKGSDGYWYYIKVLKTGKSTPDLIESCAPVANKAPEGFTLSVEIAYDAIQSGNATALSEAWGLTTDLSGNLKVS